MQAPAPTSSRLQRCLSLLKRCFKLPPRGLAGSQRNCALGGLASCFCSRTRSSLQLCIARRKLVFQKASQLLAGCLAVRCCRAGAFGTCLRRRKRLQGGGQLSIPAP